MLTPKKTIPSLAMAMLALTGCGSDANSGAGGSGASGGAGGTGGSGGTAGTGGDGLAASIRAFCMTAVECFPGYTLNECINYYNSLVSDYVVTPACEAAAASYFNCGSELSCAELDASQNSCDDEFDAIFEVCVPK